MFAEKSVFSTSNIHLPPIRRSFRRRIRPPPTPLFTSRDAKAAHIAENVSALKAKYIDYTAWLKSSTRHQREPVLQQELLKNSLCQMGIDNSKAEQLVSTCSWYVYQFQKDLKLNSVQKNSIENKKSIQYKNNIKKTIIIKDTAEDSTTTISSFDQDDSFLSASKNNQFTLPIIHVSDSSRSRHVDFGNEQKTKSILKSSKSNKIKLKQLSTESLNPLPPIDLNSSSSSLRIWRQHGLMTGTARSILRKQNSLSSSTTTSTEITNQKLSHHLLIPSSTNVNDIPLGTRSQRLFGGSEYFVQIMNELEQQN